MNDMNELPFPEWQRSLLEVVLEFDQEKLPEKTLNAEALILERLRQLQTSSNGHGEREAISNALSILKVIKRERLGYPDWRSNLLHHLPD